MDWVKLLAALLPVIEKIVEGLTVLQTMGVKVNGTIDIPAVIKAIETTHQPSA